MINMDIMRNPIRRMNRLLQKQRDEKELLRQEIIKEKEDELTSAENFLKSVNASQEEIDMHLFGIREMYDNALKF